MSKTIVLASSSPRRVQLLTEARIPFIQHVPSEVEEIRASGEGAQDYVKRLALSKAQSGLKVHPDAVVIGADTVVLAPNGDLLEKPKDHADAARMLKMLQGQTHQVITGYSLVWGTHRILRTILSLVQFRTLSDKAIESYLKDYDEWKDKAGAYAVQGIGASFVLSINGSYHNVVGLPVSHVVADLESVVENAYPAFLQ